MKHETVTRAYNKSLSTKYFVYEKIISVTTKYFIAKETCKTCDKTKKARNTAVAIYFATKFIFINFSNYLLLICIKIPSTGAKSRTLTCYI